MAQNWTFQPQGLAILLKNHYLSPFFTIYLCLQLHLNVTSDCKQHQQKTKYVSLYPIFIKNTLTLLQISKPNVILIIFISFSGSRGSPAFPGGSTLGIKMKKKEGSVGGSKSASKAASRAGSACSQFSTHSKRSLKGDNKVLQQPPVRFPF